jgi:hypothetical protein
MPKRPPSTGAGRRLTIIAGALATGALATAPTAVGASHVALWHTAGLQVNCGIEMHAPGAKATEVLCSAAGIPTPKHGFGDGGFVQLAATGGPQTLRLSQDSFAGTNWRRLGQGTLWSALGVTCSIGQTTVLCFNRDNHGFVIGGGRYRSF